VYFGGYSGISCRARVIITMIANLSLKCAGKLDKILDRTTKSFATIVQDGHIYRQRGLLSQLISGHPPT